MTQANFEKLVANTCPDKLADIFSSLDSAEMLNQDNFNRLFFPEHVVLLRADWVWKHLFPHELKRYWPTILNRASQDNPQQGLLALFHEIQEERGSQVGIEGQVLSSLSIQSLWARRHNNPETQRDFDQQYSLTVLRQ